MKRLAFSLLLLCATGVAILLLLFRAPLGLPGEWNYFYRQHPQVWFIGEGLALIALSLFYLWLGLNCAHSRRAIRALWVFGLFCAGFVARLWCGLSFNEYGSAEMSFPILWVNTEGTYYMEASGIERPSNYLRNFKMRISTERRKIHHIEVHQPGITLVFYTMLSIFENYPLLLRKVTAGAEKHLPLTLEVLKGYAKKYGHPMPIAMAVAMSLILMSVSSMSSLFAYLFARKLADERTAILSSFIVAFTPGMFFFSPGVDACYALMSFALGYVLLVTLEKRSLALAFFCGMLLYLALFFTLAYITLCFAVLIGWVVWRFMRSERVKYEPLILPAFAGFLVPVVFMWAAFHYDSFGVIVRCIRNNSLFNQMMGRSYLAWFLLNPFEGFFSLGPSMSTLVCAGFLRCIHSFKSQSLNRAELVLFSLFLTLLALDFAGVNRAETARLWLFVLPLFVPSALKLNEFKSHWGALLFAFSQLILIMLVLLFVDTQGTGRLFSNLLRGDLR